MFSGTKYIFKDNQRIWGIFTHLAKHRAAKKKDHEIHNLEGASEICPVSTIPKISKGQRKK